MSATITTTTGTYAGRSVNSIVRTQYGRHAYVRWSGDANAPQAGTIVQNVDPQGSTNAMKVLGTLVSYAGPIGHDSHTHQWCDHSADQPCSLREA